MPFKNLVQIANGAEGFFIKNNNFNTTLISFNFYMPLIKENIADNALLMYVLSSCGKEFATYTQLSNALNMLYGADISISSDKIFDMQHLRLSLTVINDEFALNNESIVNSAAKLLLSLVFNPRVRCGRFYAEDVEREKRKMIETVQGEINDKRIYAKNKALTAMFDGDAYGIPANGTLELVEKVNCKTLYDAYTRLLTQAFFRVQVVGKKMPSRIFEEIGNCFADYNRDSVFIPAVAMPLKSNRSVNTVTEEMEISQGKLVMGFSSKCYGADNFALAIMTDIFGGGPYSKLFTNVREKMSLCYYCSAAANRSKGYILVQSGVQGENADTAQKAIIEQLESVKKGDFDNFTFNASLKSFIGSLKSFEDRLPALDSWYSSMILPEYMLTPADAIKLIKNVTKQQIIDVANGIKLHTVYKLLPKVKEDANE